MFNRISKRILIENQKNRAPIQSPPSNFQTLSGYKCQRLSPRANLGRRSAYIKYQHTWKERHSINWMSTNYIHK